VLKLASSNVFPKKNFLRVTSRHLCKEMEMGRKRKGMESERKAEGGEGQENWNRQLTILDLKFQRVMYKPNFCGTHRLLVPDPENDFTS